MAHELSIRQNGKAEMAFVGETPWHGLGQQVTRGASIGVWAKEAGMDWTAKGASVVFAPETGELGRDFRVVEGNKVLYRSDTYEPLGIVGSSYEAVQPADVLEFFRDMTEREGWYIHTAGTLKGGRKLWAMATNGQIDLVTGKKSDQVLRQLLFATSLDGSMRTVVKPVATVVVCANTLAMALMEGTRTVTVSHRSVFDPAAVRRALGLSAASFDLFMAKAREMADTPMRMDEALDVLGKVFGRPPERAPKIDTSWMVKLSDLADAPPAEPQEPVARSTARTLELFDGAARGAGMAGRRMTRWGLFNAITEHVDHDMGRTTDTRVDNAWFGRGDGFKQAAFELLGTS